MAFPNDFLIELRPRTDPWEGNENPKAWETAMLQHLLFLATTDGGRALLHSIKTGGHRILIEPTLWGECNAHGGARMLNGQLIGVVKMDISSYHKGSACYTRRGRDNPAFNRGFLPQEVLFHEMIHAHRRSLGLSLESPEGTKLGGGLVRYNDEEEFVAVVLTNIFISDQTNRTKSGLRADHSGGRRLERGLDTSLGFFQSSAQVLPLLGLWRDQQPKLFDELADVKASFNPLAAMRDQQAKVAAMAQSTTARTRDRALPGKAIPKPVIPKPPPLTTVIKDVGRDLAAEALRLLRAQ